LLIGNLSNDLKKKFLESISISILNSYFTNDGVIDFQKNYLKNIKYSINEKSPDVNFKEIDKGENVFVKKKEIFEKVKEYDICIYYELSGKGTIFSNDITLKKINKLYSFCSSSNDCLVLEFISTFLSSFNKTSGDAISTFIVFEKCLNFFNYSLKDVYEMVSIYPYCFLSFEIENIEECYFDENNLKLIKPEKIARLLYEYINEQEENVKCFFKIIKNEKIIRVYIESKTLEIIKSVSHRIEDLFDEFNEEFDT